MVNLYKDLNCYLYDVWCEAAKKMGFKVRMPEGTLSVVYIDNKYIDRHFFNMLWTPYNKLHSVMVNATEDEDPLWSFNQDIQSGESFNYHLEMAWNSMADDRFPLTDAERDAFAEASYSMFPKLNWTRQDNGQVTADHIAEAWTIMLDPKLTKQALETASFNQTMGFVNE